MTVAIQVFAWMAIFCFLIWIRTFVGNIKTTRDGKEVPPQQTFTSFIFVMSYIILSIIVNIGVVISGT